MGLLEQAARVKTGTLTTNSTPVLCQTDVDPFLNIFANNDSHGMPDFLFVIGVVFNQASVNTNAKGVVLALQRCCSISRESSTASLDQNSSYCNSA